MDPGGTIITWQDFFRPSVISLREERFMQNLFLIEDLPTLLRPAFQGFNFPQSRCSTISKQLYVIDQ